MQIINVSPGDIYGYEDDPRAQDRDDLETGPMPHIRVEWSLFLCQRTELHAKC